MGEEAGANGGAAALLGGGLGKAVLELMKGLDPGWVSRFRQQQRKEEKGVLEARMHYIITSGKHILFLRPEPRGEEYRLLFPPKRGEERVRVTLRDVRFTALAFRKWGGLSSGAQCLLAAAMSGAPYPLLAPRVARFAGTYFPVIVFDRFALHPGFGLGFSRDMYYAFMRLGWHRVGFAVRGDDEYDLRRAFEGLYYVGVDGMGNRHYYINITFPRHELIRRVRQLERRGAGLIRRKTGGETVG